MATATMRKSSSCQAEHQVASLENGLSIPSSMVVAAQQQQQQPNSRVSASHSYDSGYNEAIARDEDSPTTEASAVADVFSPATAVSLGNCNKLRQRPIRMPSVIVSDCSDIANPDSFSELVICNGVDLDSEIINHHQDHNPSSPFSPASSSHSQSTSPSQEMDPADHQVNAQTFFFILIKFPLRKCQILKWFTMKLSENEGGFIYFYLFIGYPTPT